MIYDNQMGKNLVVQIFSKFNNQIEENLYFSTNMINLKAKLLLYEENKQYA